MNKFRGFTAFFGKQVFCEKFPNVDKFLTYVILMLWYDHSTTVTIDYLSYLFIEFSIKSTNRIRTNPSKAYKVKMSPSQKKCK